MFLENFLHNHEGRVVVEGQSLRAVSLTCAQVNEVADDNHLTYKRVGETWVPAVQTCHQAERELTRLRAETERQTDRIAELREDLGKHVEEKQQRSRVIGNALSLVRNAPAILASMVGGPLGQPAPTEDPTVLRYRNELVIVDLNVFSETVAVGSVSGKVATELYSITDGKIGMTDQHHLLGHMERIRQAAANGSDPVTAILDLKQEPAVEQSAATPAA